MFKKLLNLIKKEAGVPAQLFEPVPSHWKVLFVKPDDCIIRTGTAITDTSDTPVRPGNDQHWQETRQLSYIICEAAVNGKNLRFMSLGMPNDPKALHFHLLQQEQMSIWHDPSDPAKHRFDLSFLS